MALNLEEGQSIDAGQAVGQVDFEQLTLKKQQLAAAISAVRAKNPDVAAQIRVFDKQLAVQNQQLSTLLTEKKRVENLVKAQAAPSKNWDDLNARSRFYKNR